MSATLDATDVLPATRTDTPATTAARMWPLYAVLFSSVAIVVGLIWDISWHRTIAGTRSGRAHMLEQLAAIVAGSSCGWLVLQMTFGSPADQAAGVRFGASAAR
jgi:hypothetical protein